MKLTVFLLLTSILSGLAAGSYSQSAKLTLDLKNSTVKEILGNIEDQSEFRFFYSGSVDVERRTSISLKNEKIFDVLDELFKNTGVKYEVRGRQIALVKGNETFGFESVQTAQQRAVSGTVTDEYGEPLPGVTVVVKGTTQGTVTNGNGEYSLTNVPEDATLQFSFVGMKTQEIEVGNQNLINVTMEIDAIGIEEVVAVGYGTQKRVNLTGAVEQVTSEQLAKRSVANVAQAVEGLVPNLNISVPNGNPNSNPTFNIRGATSFSGNNFLKGSPLILVDGIEMDINRLNPDDIESISVIKDAAAAAIYGARGTYGVMLVTTKKGNKNKAPEVTFSSSYQIQVPAHYPDLINSVQFQETFMNAKRLNGEQPNAKDEEKLEAVKNYYNNPSSAPIYYMDGNEIVWVGNTRPFEELTRDYAPMHKTYASINGGGKDVSYYASVGYQDQNGLIDVYKDWKKRFNGIVGVSSDITDWLNIEMKAIFSQTVAEEPWSGKGAGQYNTNAIFHAISGYGLMNIFRPMYTPEDSPVGKMLTTNEINFAVRTGGTYRTKINDFAGTMRGRVKLFKGLDFTTDFTYNPINHYEKGVQPTFSTIEYSWTSPLKLHGSNSYILKRYGNTEQFTYNAYFNFSRTIKEKHEINAVAGFNQEWYKDNFLNADAIDLVSENIPVLKLTTGDKTVNDAESHWAIRGAFGRLNYIFNNKYLMEFNGRYDGTSRFGTDDRFKFFPSVSAGWRLSEESFMQNTKSILTHLKLRGSYGSLGNQNVRNYAYIATYGVDPQLWHVMNGSTIIGVSAPGLVSSNLTWETATTTDLGLDATLFEKLSLTFDWYTRKTTDILTSAEKLPAVLGADVPNQNSGEMKTTGWEGTVRWQDRLNNGLNYNLSLVISDYQSEIVKFSGNPNKLISSLYEGKKMGEIWGYTTYGLFQTYDEIAAAPSQEKISSNVWRPGDTRYTNLNDDDLIDNGENTVEDPGDLKIIGNSTPRYQWGFAADLTWHNFDVNMFWQGVGKRDYWSDSFWYWGYIAGTEPTGGIGTKWGLANSWTPERTDAFFPAYKRNNKSKQVQTKYLLNAAYARLKNLTIGYTLPTNLTKHAYISNLRIYLSGYNLFSISNIPDAFDPAELQAAGDYPIMRIYTAGIQVTF